MAKDAVSTLITDYVRFKPANSDLWRLEEFILAQDGGVAIDDKEANFVAYGMDSGFLGGRFDTVIWDDLVDKTNIRTADSRELLINWWETEAETRLDPGGLLILHGQRMAADDLYRYALNLVDWSEEFEDQPDKAPKNIIILFTKRTTMIFANQIKLTVVTKVIIQMDVCLMNIVCRGKNLLVLGLIV
jgi:hypothetical protein